MSAQHHFAPRVQWDRDLYLRERVLNSAITAVDISAGWEDYRMVAGKLLCLQRLNGNPQASEFVGFVVAVLKDLRCFSQVRVQHMPPNQSR